MDTGSGWSDNNYWTGTAIVWNGNYQANNVNLGNGNDNSNGVDNPYQVVCLP